MIGRRIFFPVLVKAMSASIETNVCELSDTVRENAVKDSPRDLLPTVSE